MTKEVAEAFSMDDSAKLSKWVSHEKHQNRRFEFSPSLILRNKNDSFLNRLRLSTRNGSFDNKKRSSGWMDHNESPRQIPQLPVHVEKTMVTPCWSAAELIQHNCLKAGKRTNAANFCQELI